MQKRPDRRSFLKKMGMGGIGAAFLPGPPPPRGTPAPGQEPDRPDSAPRTTRNYNGPYRGANLNRVAFPMGGMGAGMVCLEGSGALSHLSIRNQPDIFNEPGLFAAIALKGVPHGAKLLEGPVPDWKKFGLHEAGNGLGGATTGLPRFRDASFLPRFPFGYLDISDPDLPLSVRITGWSPFIPGDDDNSSLPVAALEYHVTNRGQSPLEAVFSFHARNFLRVENGHHAIQAFPQGFILQEEGASGKPAGTAMVFFTDDRNTVVDHCWFRGGWWDPLTMAWNSVKNAEVKQVDPVPDNAPGASLFVPFTLGPGRDKTIRLQMAWYAPETELTYGKMGVRKEDCDPQSGCCNSPGDLLLDKYDKDFHGKYYTPWYSSRFASIREVAEYWRGSYESLKNKSTLFKEAFYASTLPPEVVEAVAANLSILKSPTVMRQFDGRLWSFEGCGDTWGCCHGSCTHVWNYAQAIPHLFPALERSLRHTEFCENQDARGHQNFRANLPIEPATHDFHAAADGQLGGIMKVYREWRISGNQEWLQKMFPMVKTSMDYCIRTWDPRNRGAIEEPHHNTYDIEFWGPDGMHGSFYIGALDAISAMGKSLGKDVSSYEILAARARQVMEHELYDGEYFFQKIQFTGLNAKDPTTLPSFGGDYSQEARELLRKEGPKYQYGKGCLSDGVLGAWIARMCGLGDTLDSGKISSHLRAVHKYNFKKSLREHANPQRPAYALGEEGGLLLCTWPKGGKLSLPFVYSDEVWTGIEHQVASHLMMMGQVREGLEILRASRDRYDGRIRNPFNEYECGHWYARALSSYGYLQALTGVRYDAVDKTLYLDSKIGDFTSFLATESGFGTVSLRQGKPSVHFVYGNLEVSKVVVSGKAGTLLPV
ncbi:MAG TPA: GH116 family glycosyl hydrolase [Chitinophagaceae bacterium]|nr:GH116 family glycosyl hydrolase [Chitinophagaceae bacterium]